MLPLFAFGVLAGAAAFEPITFDARRGFDCEHHNSPAAMTVERLVQKSINLD